MFFVFLILIFLSFWFWVSSDLFSVYFSGVLVAILVFCSLSHLFFSGQNDKVEKLTSNKRTRDSNDCQGPNYISYKTSELEFRITSIKILAGLEKSIEYTKELLSGEIKELKSNQVDIKKDVNEMQ